MALRPQRRVALEHRGQRVAHIARAAQLPVGQPRLEPQCLPRQGQVAVVVQFRPLELFAAHLQLRVVEEHLGTPRVFPAPALGLLRRPGDELVDQLPKRAHALGRLPPQPFAQRGFISKGVQARQPAGQRVLLDPFGIGQRGAARREAIEELGNHGVRAEAAALALARIDQIEPAQLAPQIEPLSECFQGGQTAQHGLTFGGDKLEFDSGRSLVNGRHEHMKTDLSSRIQLKLRPNAIFFTRHSTRQTHR